MLFTGTQGWMPTISSNTLAHFVFALHTVDLKPVCNALMLTKLQQIHTCCHEPRVLPGGNGRDEVRMHDRRATDNEEAQTKCGAEERPIGQFPTKIRGAANGAGTRRAKVEESRNAPIVRTHHLGETPKKGGGGQSDKRQTTRSNIF